MVRHKDKEKIHEPVMVHEVLEFFNLAPLKEQAHVIDATVGSGGHAIEMIGAGAEVLGIDADAEMLEVAKKRLEKACPTMYRLVHGNFRNIARIARDNEFTKVDGILFDLGVASQHFASTSRGFSFSEKSAPLDMRLDVKTQAVTAANLLNLLPENQLQKLFGATMTNQKASKLTRTISLARNLKPIKKVGDFLEIADRLPKTKSRLHPATLPFLALRMAVNSELENLEEALPKAFKLLKIKGRLVIISFHSGEDAIVKHFFRKLEKQGKAQVLTKKPVLPSEEEVKKNIRARSAKLRVLERT
ncbi:16S rRNA (cytosine(1402)-N(4))-methyltransferase RsmH [Candidatus Woesebacteria bacterium]|nr:MAG: 16S rRNA (cytosine(1402)-N(4))-methyltransferase RsmH [Candidatus Woesebacteria bacterium]